MSGPELHKTGDLFELRWPGQPVQIDVSRLHDGREGVTAEMTVRAVLAGVTEPHLAFGRINLTSIPARKAWASLLGDRCNGTPIDWPRMLEQAAIRVVGAAREGEPVITLGQTERPPRPPWLIDGFLRQGEHTVLFGYKATLKSLMALAFAYDVYTGVADLGRDVQQGPVLCLDWECDAATAEERLWLLAAGRGDAKPPAALYRRMTRPLVEDLTAVRRICDREGVVLTIIDSQGLAIGQAHSGHDPAAGVLAFYGAAREIGGTILGIDHRPADDSGGKPKPYGSVYKQNAARSLWLAKTTQEPGAADLHVGLFHQLANNYGIQRPIGFHVTFTEDAVRIAPEDARDTPLLREGLGAGERCWLALIKPMATGLLAEEVELKPNTVRQACGRDQRIMKVGSDGSDTIWARVANRDDEP